MKRLSNSVKKMLNGLAQQDAGDYLPMSEKLQVLGVNKTNVNHSTAVKPTANRTQPLRRIAMVTDGRGIDAPLDYAIEACTRQSASIELLVHGTPSVANVAQLKNKIAAAGIDAHIIKIAAHAGNNIAEYCARHPTLDFVVAMPNDPTILSLHLPVPLVLIESHPTLAQPTQSAA